MYLFILGGGEENKAENKLNYIPSRQTLMTDLKKSNAWYAQLLFQEHPLYCGWKFFLCVRTKKEKVNLSSLAISVCMRGMCVTESSDLFCPSQLCLSAQPPVSALGGLHRRHLYFPANRGAPSVPCEPVESGVLSCSDRRDPVLCVQRHVLKVAASAALRRDGACFPAGGLPTLC